jgi:hypothetical protein
MVYLRPIHEENQMGSGPNPIKPWHDTPPRPIDDRPPEDCPCEPILDDPVLPCGPVTLEDLGELPRELEPCVAVRGSWEPPRFAIYAGELPIGFVPTSESADLRRAMDLHGGVLHGRVVSVGAHEVSVELGIEGA